MRLPPPRAKCVVGRGGFEPPKAEPPDLQSGPFDRFGISPQTELAASSEARDGRRRFAMELAVGLEPTTSRLQGGGSAN